MWVQLYPRAINDYIGEQQLSTFKRKVMVGAAENKLYALAFVPPYWNRAQDTLFTGHPANRILLYAHGIRLSAAAFRDNKTDYWPELRQLIDGFLLDCIEKPTLLTTMNQSQARTALYQIIDNNNHAPIPLLSREEIHQIHTIACSLRKEPIGDIKPELSEILDNRRHLLKEHIQRRGICWGNNEDRSDYYLSYFNL